MNAQIEGQMSIFDFLKPSTAYPDINDITEGEAVSMVEDALGIEFTYSPQRSRWEAKLPNKKTLHIRYNNFVKDGSRFVSDGYDCKGCEHQCGGGAPCKNISEAVEYFNRVSNKCDFR